MPAKTIKRATTAKVRTLTKKARGAAAGMKSGTAAKAGATKAGATRAPGAAKGGTAAKTRGVTTKAGAAAAGLKGELKQQYYDLANKAFRK